MYCIDQFWPLRYALMPTITCVSSEKLKLNMFVSNSSWVCGGSKAQSSTRGLCRGLQYVHYAVTTSTRDRQDGRKAVEFRGTVNAPPEAVVVDVGDAPEDALHGLHPASVRHSSGFGDGYHLVICADWHGGQVHRRGLNDATSQPVSVRQHTTTRGVKSRPHGTAGE